jgi:hypothetical protein
MLCPDQNTWADGRSTGPPLRLLRRMPSLSGSPRIRSAPQRIVGRYRQTEFVPTRTWHPLAAERQFGLPHTVAPKPRNSVGVVARFAKTRILLLFGP